MHDVDHLKLQRAVAKPLEMGAIKAQRLLRTHQAFHDARNRFQLLGRGVVAHLEAEHNPALAHGAVVADDLLEDVGVGHHHLLALQAEDAGGLEPDHLHRARDIAHHHKVAHLKRLVHRNRQRGKQVTQNVLHRQRHGNAPHTQTGHKRSDVHPQV